MTTDLELSPTTAVDLAREALYRFLAAAVAGPRNPNWELVQNPDCRRAACDAADLLRSEAGEVSLGFGELPPALLTLQPLDRAVEESPDTIADEYVHVFGLIGAKECPPYETEYHATSEPFFRAQQMADVGGFYRAFGLDTSSRLPERPDHLALELEFMAFLLAKRRWARDSEQVAVCADAEADFFRDHLAWWVSSLAAGMRRLAGTGFYAAVGQALGAFLPLERARFGVAPPRMPLQTTSVEERPEQAEECAGCTG